MTTPADAPIAAAGDPDEEIDVEAARAVAGFGPQVSDDQILSVYRFMLGDDPEADAKVAALAAHLA